MTHDELRVLLPAYRAGTLDQAKAEAVRAHLATGCLECWHEVFPPAGSSPRVRATEEPPVPPAEEGPPPSPAAKRPPLPLAAEALPVPPTAPAVERPRGRGRGWIVALALLALVLAGLLGWGITEVRRREALWQTEVAQLRTELEQMKADRAELAARIESLDRDLAAARAESAERAKSAQASTDYGAEAASEASAPVLQLKQELEAAQTRIGLLTRNLQQLEAEIARLRAATDAQQGLRVLIERPGLEMLRLSPVAPFTDPRGHVLWHPGVQSILLYVFNLSVPPNGGSYRVRVELEDGRLAVGPTLALDGRGDAIVPIRLGVDARLREVQVVLDPTGDRVLAGQARVPE